MSDTAAIFDPSTASMCSPMASVNNVIEVLYGSDEPQKAYCIPTSKITKLELRESFFMKLPTLKLFLSDVGTLFHDVGFQIGHTITVKVTPIMNDPDTVTKPYVDSKFVIQTIEYVFNPDNSTYLYELNCVYAAEKYINDICVWPITEIDVLNLEKHYTSEEVLSFICSRGGLQFASELAMLPDDNMAWLNSSLTYAEFADKVVKHAWVGDDDMPILYVDRNGLAHYNSINNLCNSASRAIYMNTTLYNAKYRDDKRTSPCGYRVYSDLELKNVGYVQNQGAYGVKTKIYNPYNLLAMNPITFLPDIPNNPANITLNDACIRNKDFHDNKQRIAIMGNKSPGQTDSFRYAYSRMHFKQTHQYYDYAPQHNESIRRAFFQQFAFLTIDVPNQPDFYFDPLQKVELGDRITVRADTVDRDTTIQSGDFLVTGLIHSFFANSNYTLVITGVNDGINGAGPLKKESDKK